MTLSAYSDLIAHGSHLRGHAQALRAALGAARCLSAVARTPALATQRKRDGVLFTDDELLAMTPADRKKAELKIRKAEKRAADEEAAAKEKARAEGKKLPTPEDEERAAEVRDDDPFGEKALRVAEPLTAARKLLSEACAALPPSFRVPPAVDSTAAAQPAAVFSTPAVVGLEARPGSVSREWRISAADAADAHALAAEVELAAGSSVNATAHSAAVARINQLFPDSVRPATLARATEVQKVASQAVA